MSNEYNNVINPAWDLHSKDYIDLSTQKKDMIFYPEDNLNTISSQTSYTFQTRDLNSYLLFHEAHLEVRCKIQTDTTPAVDITTQDVAIQNGILSAFRDAQLYINSVGIEQNNSPAEIFHVRALAECSKGHIDTCLSKCGYFLEKTDRSIGKLSNVIRFFVTAGTAANIGNEVFFNTANTTANGRITVHTGTVANGDTITAFLGDYKKGPQVRFYLSDTSTQALSRDETEFNLVIADATGLSSTVTAANNGAVSRVRAYADGMPVQFLIGDVDISLNIPANGTIIVNSAGTNGVQFTAHALGYAQGPSAFEKRRRLTENGKEATFYVGLNRLFGFADSFRKATRGLSYKIVLQKNEDRSSLLKAPFNKYGVADATNYKLVITHAGLWIPSLTPSDEVRAKLDEMMFQNSLIKVNFIDWNIAKSDSKTKTSTNNSTFQLASNKNKVVRVYVGFKSANRDGGSQIYNRRLFDDVRTSRLVFRYNGMNFPNLDFQMEVTDSKDTVGWERVYSEWLLAHGKKEYNDDASIDFETFRRYYPHYCIDLSDQPDSAFQAKSNTNMYVEYSNDVTNAFYYGGGDYLVQVVYCCERTVGIETISGSMAIRG